MTNWVIRLQNIDDMTKLFRNAFTHTAVEKPPIGLKTFIKHKLLFELNTLRSCHPDAGGTLFCGRNKSNFFVGYTFNRAFVANNKRFKECF